MLEKMFKLKENNTDVKTEVIGGLTTFMTMAYILAVNPSILSASAWTQTRLLWQLHSQHLSEPFAWHF